MKSTLKMKWIIDDIWDYIWKPYSPFHKMGGECKIEEDGGIITITLMGEK